MADMFDPVGSVWLAISDRRWHTVKELAERLNSPDMKVALVVNFLAEYGFIQTSRRMGAFRRVSGAPSPNELVRTFRSLTS